MLETRDIGVTLEHVRGRDVVTQDGPAGLGINSSSQVRSFVVACHDQEQTNQRGVKRWRDDRGDSAGCSDPHTC